MNSVKLRTANIRDAKDILHIYSYYVEHTAITFEYTVPTEEDFGQRIASTLEKYPYLVAIREGKILGYAYAGPFVGRAAYDWSAEVSIYLDPRERGQGLGRRLYESLENALRQMGILNLYACIGYPEIPDAYLTPNSFQFHSHLGYTKVGEFHNCGYKFRTWYHMIWMEKIIGEHQNIQPPIRPYLPENR